MTIDERLDKLTERHGALAQTVELLAAEVRATSANVDTLTADVNKLMGGFAIMSELFRRHDARVDHLEGH